MSLNGSDEAFPPTSALPLISPGSSQSPRESVASEPPLGLRHALYQPKRIAQRFGMHPSSSSPSLATMAVRQMYSSPLARISVPNKAPGGDMILEPPPPPFRPGQQRANEQRVQDIRLLETTYGKHITVAKTLRQELHDEVNLSLERAKLELRRSYMPNQKRVKMPATKRNFAAGGGGGDEGAGQTRDSLRSSRFSLGVSAGGPALTSDGRRPSGGAAADPTFALPSIGGVLPKHKSTSALAGLS